MRRLMIIPPIVISFKNSPPMDKEPTNASINISANIEDSAEILITFFEDLPIVAFFVLTAILSNFVDANLNKIFNKYIFIV